MRAIRAAIADLEGGTWMPTSGETSPVADAGESPRSLAGTPGVHEWIVDSAGRIPPLAVLIDLAWDAIAPGTGSDGNSGRHPEASAVRSPHPGRVVWIGRGCWPYPRALVRWASPGEAEAGTGDRRLLERSVFVRAGEGAGRGAVGERVWAIEQAARCAGVACVIADGHGIGMGESRRLQLAASEGAMVGHADDPGRPVWLVRPMAERRVLSAARTRWIVRPRAPDRAPGRAVVGGYGQAPLEESGPAGIGEDPMEWWIELVRCKGVRASLEGGRRWCARRTHDTGAIEWHAETHTEHRAAGARGVDEPADGPADGAAVDVGLAADAVHRAARPAWSA
jgi:hypothetical protein